MGRIVAVILMFAGSTAMAGWFVEPYATYESGTLAQKDNSDFDLSGKTSMTALGVRFGYKIPRQIWIALDYSSGFGGTFKYNDATNGTDAKTNRNDAGITLGYDHAGKFRMYLGYVIEPSYRVVESSNQETYFLNGTAGKLGLGYVRGWFSFSVEYYSNAPTKYKIDSGTYSVTDTNSVYKESGFRAVASFPWVFTK